MGNGGKCNDRKLAPEAVKWQTIPCSAFFFVLHCSACHLFALHRGKQRECFDFLLFGLTWTLVPLLRCLLLLLLFLAGLLQLLQLSMMKQ